MDARHIDTAFPTHRADCDSRRVILGCLFVWFSVKLLAVLLVHLLLLVSWSYQTLLLLSTEITVVFNNTLRPGILQTLFQI